MNAQVQIQGSEVIGLPGQNLTQDELYVLVNLAEGVPTPVVATSLKLDMIGIRNVELSILGKLAAKNKVHMITRGFTLGVLIPQALCLMLCLISVIEAGDDFTRPKTQRRSRSLTEHSRNYRASPSNAGGQGRQALYG